MRLNRLGDKMAGQRKRRKIHALMRLSLMSSCFRSSHLSRRLENTFLNSLRGQMIVSPVNPQCHLCVDFK